MQVKRLRVVPSDVGDIYRLVREMRSDDRLEATSLGRDPTSLLRDSYRAAILRRTAFVDGEIAAMWGLGGVMLSDEGAPWLVTTKAFERVPLAFVKQGRIEIAQMLALRSRLSNVVQASYTRACRFLEVLGFNLDEPTPMGPNNEPFRRFWMVR